MKIVVCMKQVPDTTEVKIDPVTNTLIRDGVPAIINPDDKCGIEAALQIKEQIRESDISCLVVLLTCFYSERTGQVGLSAPGCTGDKKIPVFCDIFTDCKPFNQGTVQLAPGSIVNVANVCIRLVEPGIADQALQTVSLTVTVFDVHQHPETVLKGGLRLGILHLGEECI